MSPKSSASAIPPLSLKSGKCSVCGLFILVTVGICLPTMIVTMIVSPSRPIDLPNRFAQ